MAYELDELLRHMVRIGASDLHLKSGRPPLFRVSGVLDAVPDFDQALAVGDTIAIAKGIMADKDREDFRNRKNADFSYALENGARFRVNVFQQRGTVALVLRTIPAEVPTVDAMGLPEVLKEMTRYHQGLILVTGPTGSGKSTTLAAMINYINQHKKVNIITLEDPIEFYHEDKLASVNQREMGADSPSFEDALRGVLRQDPDIILLGEMRDAETIETALTAAETGHLVFSTLHTNSAPQSIKRIANVFPKESQQHILSQLSTVLVGVVSQQLVRRASGEGRAAALEIMRNNPGIAKNIMEGNIEQLTTIIENSVAGEHMQSMNQSLCALWANNLVTREEAMAKSTDPDELQQMYDRYFFKDEQPDELQDEERGALPPASEMPQFADRLEELAFYQDIYSRTQDKGLEDQVKGEERLAKLKEEWEWAMNQLNDLKDRLQELKDTVDQAEHDWEQKVKQKDGEIRQLELAYNRLKREIGNAEAARKKKGLFN